MNSAVKQRSFQWPVVTLFLPVKETTWRVLNLLLAKHRPLLSVALARKEKGCLFCQGPLYQQLSWEINECLHLAPLSRETKNSESAEKGSFHGATEYIVGSYLQSRRVWHLQPRAEKRSFFYSSSCSWFISSIMRLIKLWASAGRPAGNAATSASCACLTFFSNVPCFSILIWLIHFAVNEVMSERKLRWSRLMWGVTWTTLSQTVDGPICSPTLY